MGDHRGAVAFLLPVNQAAARRLSASLRAAYVRLAEHPLSAHRREDLSDDPNVRFATVGNHLIVVRISARPNARSSAQPVVILRVLHTSCDVARILGGEDPTEE